jgi:hypothetical protein
MATRWRPSVDALIGNIIERLQTDKGYRGHNAPPDYKFGVLRRRVTPQIKRSLRRRSAIERVTGHPNPNTGWAAITSGNARVTPSMLS